MAGSSELAEVGRGEIRPEVVELLCRLRGEPVLTTEEIAKPVGVPKPMAEKMLDSLAQSEMIECKRHRSGDVLWYCKGYSCPSAPESR